MFVIYENTILCYTLKIIQQKYETQISYKDIIMKTKTYGKYYNSSGINISFSDRENVMFLRFWPKFYSVRTIIHEENFYNKIILHDTNKERKKKKGKRSVGCLCICNFI